MITPERRDENKSDMIDDLQDTLEQLHATVRIILTKYVRLETDLECEVFIESVAPIFTALAALQTAHAALTTQKEGT